MAQPQEKTNTESMFRQDARTVSVTSISAQDALAQKLGVKKGFPTNDPRYGDDENDERDEHGKKKRRKFKLTDNSDEAQLARASGNYNIGETFEEYSSNPVTQAREAYADYQEQTYAIEESFSYWDSVSDYASETYDSISEWGNETFESVNDWGNETFDSINDWGNETFESINNWGNEVADSGVKAFDDYVAKPFTEYVAKPLGEAWDTTVKAASNAVTTVSDAVSSVGTSVKNVASSAGTAISNAASSVGTVMSSGWTSLKNFALGESKPEETKLAETQKPAVVQNLSVPKDDAPAKLVGEQNAIKPASTPSLSSAFGSAVDNSKVAEAAPATPVFKPAPAPGMSMGGI